MACLIAQWSVLKEVIYVKLIVKDPLTWAILRKCLKFVKLAPLLTYSNCSTNGGLAIRTILLELWELLNGCCHLLCILPSPGAGVKQMLIIFVRYVFQPDSERANNFIVPCPYLCPVMSQFFYDFGNYLWIFGFSCLRGSAPPGDHSGDFAYLFLGKLYFQVLGKMSFHLEYWQLRF